LVVYGVLIGLRDVWFVLRLVDWFGLCLVLSLRFVLLAVVLVVLVFVFGVGFFLVVCCMLIWVGCLLVLGWCCVLVLCLCIFGFALFASGLLSSVGVYSFEL